MKSLGIIETIGLASGIEAMDAALKSANVELIGYELSKGDGMATIKLEGNIGAVTAAIHAAEIAASKVNGFFNSKVIPRPNSSIELFIRNNETVGYEIKEEIVETKLTSEEDALNKIEAVTHSNEEVDKTDIVNEFTCNLCKDPKCIRKKGDPKNSCIKFKK